MWVRVRLTITFGVRVSVRVSDTVVFSKLLGSGEGQGKFRVSVGGSIMVRVGVVVRFGRISRLWPGLNHDT